jgi:hypothetical protein
MVRELLDLLRDEVGQATVDVERRIADGEAPRSRMAAAVRVQLRERLAFW